MLILERLAPRGATMTAAKRYLEFHRLDDAQIELFTDFEDAFESMFNGHIQHVIQVAVHPSVTHTVAKYRAVRISSIRSFHPAKRWAY